MEICQAIDGLLSIDQQSVDHCLNKILDATQLAQKAIPHHIEEMEKLIEDLHILKEELQDDLESSSAIRGDIKEIEDFITVLSQIEEKANNLDDFVKRGIKPFLKE